MSQKGCRLRAVKQRRASPPNSPLHFLPFNDPARTAGSLLILMAAIPVFAQTPPASPDRPWHSSYERQFISNGRGVRQPAFPIDPEKSYSLAELVDLAEAHNPETRVAWENARAQG